MLVAVNETGNWLYSFCGDVQATQAHWIHSGSFSSRYILKRCSHPFPFPVCHLRGNVVACSAAIAVLEETERSSLEQLNIILYTYIHIVFGLYPLLRVLWVRQMGVGEMPWHCWRRCRGVVDKYIVLVNQSSMCCKKRLSSGAHERSQSCPIIYHIPCQHRTGPAPNVVTYNSLISACGKAGSPDDWAK